MKILEVTLAAMFFLIAPLAHAADGAERSIQRNEQFRVDQAKLEKDRAYHRALAEKEDAKANQKMAD